MARLFLLIAFVFFLLPKTILAHSETQIIEMTANGFEPQEAAVDENSTVIFINKEKQARWPASNVHPTHDIYPEFDPKRAINSKESWSFKFQKAGQWKYHDHLFPHIRGTITVVSEGGQAPAPSGAGQAQTSSWQKNFKDFIQSFIFKVKNIFSFFKKEDAAKGWEDLKQKYKAQAGSSGDIHDQAHLAGSLLYKKQGFNGIAVCSPEFAFGCFHGFLDEAFKSDLDHLEDAYKACGKLGPVGSGPMASCIHGIGHGVASFYLSSDLKKSLFSCRKLTTGSEFCFDGVFMEFARSAAASFYKREDPLYPCNQLEKEFGYTYSFECGRNQSAVLMSRFKMGFDKVVDICKEALSKPFKQACFESLGFSLAGSLDKDKIIAGCQTIQIPEYVASCAKSAAGELIFQEAPNWYENSRSICQAFPASQEACLQYLDRLIAQYNRQVKINYDLKGKNEDINAYIRNQLKKCYDVGGRDGCYKDAAQVFYDQFGLASTVQTLKTNEAYPEVYARCHEVTHYLSRLEYNKLKNIAKVYAQCDSTCHGGCFHGTMEAYLKEKQQADQRLLSDFPKVCGQGKDYPRELEFNECLHGMGHAAMFVTEMELKDSLKLCDTILNKAQRERCYTGVFMENSSSSTSFDHKAKYIKADDPFYPCNSLDEKYLPMCWQYQSSYFAIIQKQDWVKVASMCLQVPKAYQDRCVRTIGTNQVGFTPSVQVMKKDCDLMPSTHFQNVCVEGVISSMSYRFVGDYKRMIEFCSLVKSQNKESCFKQMGISFKDWTTDKNSAKSNCGKIADAQGRSWCLEAV